MLHRVLLLLAFIGTPFYLSGQCGVTVDAGPDLTVCSGGGSVRLMGGSLDGTIVEAVWTPATGLSDPNDLEPTATISGPVTYTLTAQVFDPTANLIINGDFEAGDTGFFTSYDLGSVGNFGLLSDEGEYVISTNSNLTHDNFSDCPDHTGGGNMMVINGSSFPAARIWCQTVTVSPNTDYVFNAWLQSVHPSNPARLRFSVNGQALGDSFRASGTTCDWRRFDEVWSSGSGNSATICITNRNFFGNGNDFAIDDIFFGPVCERQDEVDILEVATIADAPATLSLPCDIPPQGILIDGSASSSGANYFYRWTTADGNLLSGTSSPIPRINAPGIYELEVSFDDGINVCTDQTTVVVTGGAGVPDAAAGSLNDINCTTETAMLTVAGSATGDDVRYEWTTNDGNIQSGANGPSPVVDEAGTYTLTVIHIPSGCNAKDTVEVISTVETPDIAVQEAPPFTCGRAQMLLSGSGNSSFGPIRFSWTASNGGTLLSGENTDSPTVAGSGNYVLTVINPLNGCSADSTIFIGENILPPLANAGPGFTLTCASRQDTLRGIGPEINVAYRWTTDDGNFLADSLTHQPVIDAVGTYFLLATDTTNACVGRDTVVIDGDADAPQIRIADAGRLDCRTRELTLNANDSDSGPEIQTRWTTDDGNIVSGEDGLQAMIDAAGTYQIRLKNPVSGCADSASVRVAMDTIAPLAMILPPTPLDCRSTRQELLAGDSSQGDAFRYAWNSAEGNIISGAASLMPVVDEAGTYVLAVQNVNNGCVTTDSVSVRQDAAPPELSILPPELLTCTRSEVTLAGNIDDPDIAGFLIFWTDADGNFLSGESPLSPRVTAPGRYRLTASNRSNGCRSVLSVTVGQNTNPPEVNIGPDIDLSCDRDPRELSVAATGIGPFIYGWSTTDGRILSDADRSRPLSAGPGTYTVTVTDQGNGCVAIEEVMTVQDLPGSFAFRQVAPDCRVPTGSVVFESVSGGFSPFLYSVDGGATFQPDSLVGGLEAGAYGLVVQDAKGCEIQQQTNIPFPPELNIFLDERALISLGDSFRLNTRSNFPDSTFTTISWTPAADLSCDTCLRPTAAPHETTTYTLDVETADGCRATDQLELLVDRSIGLYFPTAFSPGGDGVNDRWIPFAKSTLVRSIPSIRIYDRWGNAVFSAENLSPNDAAAGWDGTLRGRLMNPAVFIFSAQVEFADGRVEAFKGEIVLVR